MLGSTELVVIALIIFVLFGSAAIPKFARSIGLAKSEFDKAIDTKKDTPEATEKDISEADASNKQT
jgi:TatA/E family protein of Tat protein translocase